MLVTLAALAALPWYLNSPAPVEVAQAEVGRNDEIIAAVDSCGDELSVDVYEDDSVVAIRVFDHRFRIRFGGDDCRESIHIPLSVPLGGRMLFDGSTGDALLIPGS